MSLFYADAIKRTARIDAFQFYARYDIVAFMPMEHFEEPEPPNMLI